MNIYGGYVKPKKLRTLFELRDYYKGCMVEGFDYATSFKMLKEYSGNETRRELGQAMMWAIGWPKPETHLIKIRGYIVHNDEPNDTIFNEEIAAIVAQAGDSLTA